MFIFLICSLFVRNRPPRPAGAEKGRQRKKHLAATLAKRRPGAFDEKSAAFKLFEDKARKVQRLDVLVTLVDPHIPAGYFINEHDPAIGIFTEFQFNVIEL